MNTKEIITGEESRVKCVTFSIGRGIYGIDVLMTREVIYLVNITEVPGRLPFMKGVIDIRGEVIPLVDTRMKFKLEPKEYDEDTVIIIVETKNHLMGLIVDSVLDVLDIALDDIQDAGNLSEGIETSYVKGISKSDDKLIIILDVHKILSNEEFKHIDVNENV